MFALGSEAFHNFFSFKDFYLFIFRERGKKGEKNVWLLLSCPLLVTWSATQACALTGNQTSDTLVHSLAFSPLSHTSQSSSPNFNRCDIHLQCLLKCRFLDSTPTYYISGSEDGAQDSAPFTSPQGTLLPLVLRASIPQAPVDMYKPLPHSLT